MPIASPTSAFNANERRIVHFTGFGHAATHYVELVYPTLAVGLAAETGLPLTEVLAWSFAGYLLFGLGALPAGIVADHFGARPVILFGLMGSGLSAGAASFVDTGWPIALCLAGIGTSASCYHPAGTGLLSRAVRARGRALGINGIYGNAGIALAPLMTALLSERVGWRATFGLTGAVLLIATWVFARMDFSEPKRAPVAPQAEPKHEPESKNASAPSALGLGPFLTICFTATLGGFMYRANTVAQPALFASEIDFMGYGMAASGAMLLGLVGQYLGGLVADKWELRGGYLFFHVASVPLLIAIAWTSGVSLLMTSALYVFFALGMQPIENSLFAALTPERWRSTAYGIKFTLTFGVGSTAVWLVYEVARTDGWSAVYWALVGVALALIVGIGALYLLTLGRPVRNR
ncbi:MAG: MFS transporter [Myxococcota bacterium]|nr:MFS transporter [Myxococcota bacterium]